MSAWISSACGLSPGPGGFFAKSSRSFPAVNESPAPCKSTTLMRSSLPASLRRSAKPVYMFAVIAFFLAGRLNSIRSMLPDLSVTISLIFWLQLGVRDAGQVSLGHQQRLLVRSVEIRAIKGTREIRYEHPSTFQVQCQADSFHQVGKDDLGLRAPPRRCIHGRTVHGVAAGRIA